MTISFEEQVLGRDLWMPDEPTDSLQVGPTGDLLTVAGGEAVRAGLRRRATSAPGQMVHRPEFGAGLERHLEHRSVGARLALMAGDLRRNAMRDPRVEEVITSASTEGSAAIVAFTARLRRSQREVATTVRVDP